MPEMTDFERRQQLLLSHLDCLRASLEGIAEHTPAEAESPLVGDCGL
ncbi:MAG: hypothetical protein JO161_09475 [Planctomycetaceae bacterium]|nr:hypothetical protein [Planctomycetaceae bacterium]